MTHPQHQYRAPIDVPPAVRRRPRTWVIVLAAVVGLVLLVGCLAAVGSAIGQAGGEVARGIASTSAAGGRPVAVSPAPAVTPLEVDDVKIRLKTEKRECFGSAGCVMTVEPVLSWPADRDPDGAYDVTYKITYQTLEFDGSREVRAPGETIGTAYILGDGDQYEHESHILTTASKTTKVEIVVDQLERRVR